MGLISHVIEAGMRQNYEFHPEGKAKSVKVPRDRSFTSAVGLSPSWNG
jgi:hypothetical protein